MKPSPPERPERRTRSRIAVPAAPTLRQQAVVALQAQAKQPPQRQPADAPETNRQLLHELSVHQIQLELQNEELRRAQIELDASRARYFDLYDLAPVAYCTVSASGQIALANLACATLLDLPRAALTHKMLARFVHHESSDGYFLFCKKTFDSDTPQDCELRMQKSDGTPFWARLEAVATQDADGAPALRSVLIDISASKRDEQKLRDMAQGLEAIVSQRTQQLRAAWAQLTLSEERERRLLAQDLHDNLGQLLAIIKIKLSALESCAPLPLTGTLSKLVDQAIDSVRNVTLQLSPPILHTLGLIPALEWLVEEMARGYHLAIKLNSSICSKPLDAEVQAMLFRAVRELLINVARHAKTSQASLDCSCQERCLRLRVSDNGCGFVAPDFAVVGSAQAGFGLGSVHQRLVNVGGSMSIHSHPGQGSTVVLSVPCSMASRECPLDPHFAG